MERLFQERGLGVSPLVARFELSVVGGKTPSGRL